MLGIIVTILKFIGIGIGILLAAVLLLLLLLLFVPVRYEVRGENTEQLQGEGKVHWLCRIVTFQVSYDEEEKDGQLRQVLKIFGIPVYKK